MSHRHPRRDVPNALLRPAAALALHMLINAAHDRRIVEARVAAAAIEQELMALTWRAARVADENDILRVDRDEARAQVLTDRAELDGYRNLYGAIPKRTPSPSTDRMSA